MMEDESKTKIEVPKKDKVNIEPAEPEKGDEQIEIPVTESPVEPAPAQPVAEKTDDGMKEISLAPPIEPQAGEEPVQPASQEEVMEPPKTEEQTEPMPAIQEEQSIQPEPEPIMQEPVVEEQPAQEPAVTDPAQIKATEEPAQNQEQVITPEAAEVKDSEPAPIQVDDFVQQRELAGESKGIESVEGAAPSPNDAEARELTGNDALTPMQSPTSEELPDVHKRWATRDALPASTEPSKPRELSQEEKVQEAIRLHQENNKPKGFLARIRKIIGW